MNEIVIQIPIYKTAVLIYWGDRKGLYKAVKRNSDKEPPHILGAIR